MLNNLLLKTDCYKMGHLTMYPDNLAYIYSVLEPRKMSQWCQLYPHKEYLGNGEVYMFGLRYYLNSLPEKITANDVQEFYEAYETFIGEVPLEIKEKLTSLVDLGYLPLEIKAVPEFDTYPYTTPLVTVENTHPDFAWLVGFIEGYLLKLWYPISVSTLSKAYCDLSEKLCKPTVSEDRWEIYESICVHDFGFRGCSSDESAAIGGASHLINKPASDTVLGWDFLKKHYPEKAKFNKPLSVGASEHSIMCAYGLENEELAFRTLLEKYPTGVISLVSDTYNIYEVCSTIMNNLKDVVLSRDGVCTLRPDSGDHVEVLLGTEDERGILARLEEVFGSYINDKGYKVLNDKVRLIWGDGFTLDTYIRVFEGMERAGWSAENLIVGIGALLLNLHQRDDHGFAFKASYVTDKEGNSKIIQKNPITDIGKKSKQGKVVVTKDKKWYDLSNPDDYNNNIENNILATVYKDGALYE